MKKIISFIFIISFWLFPGLTFSSGECIEGDCVNGQGTILYSDGEKYEGGIKDGMKHGQGVTVYKNGNTYVGGYKNNKKHGQGTYTVPDGSIYEGGLRVPAIIDWPGVVPDPITGAAYLHQIYTRAQPEYTGRVTVPVLWDRETMTIVNNESADIIRFFDREFGALGTKEPQYCPPKLEDEIDEINAFVYRRINNGVYRAGFATTQEAYDEAVTELFAALDEIEDRLGRSRYLLGNRVTEADVRLFTTLVRFDSVYVGHFKCNLRRLVDYPNLWGWTRELYQMPGVAPTVDFDHIKAHYYRSHSTINPTGVVPKGPTIDFSAPHGRA